MKPLTYPNLSPLRFVLAALLFLSAISAQAQILLVINDANPSAVTITASGGFPITSASDSFNNGVDLLGFFTSSVGFTQFTVNSSTLTTGDASTGPIYDTAVGDNLSTQNVDLTLYSTDPTDTETFTALTAAFKGAMSLDLSGAGLPLAGTGAIVTGYSGSSPNTTIGEWEVLSVSAPEPSTWALLLVGLGAAVIYRFRLRHVRLPAKAATTVD